MRPFYFGPAERRLFGIHFPPQYESEYRCTVVLCPSLGHEYVNSFRAFRVLAQRLAGAGFYVMRFDYYGTGDSAGDAEGADLGGLIGDVHSAVDEAKRMSGVTTVVLVGLRFGGSVAVLAGTEREDVTQVVLWQPVVSGESYLRDLAANHAAWAAAEAEEGRDAASEAGGNEILGFPLSITLRDELKTMSLLSVGAPPADEVLLLDEADDPHLKQYASRLASLCAVVDRREVSASLIWSREVGVGQSIVPSPTINDIVSWASGAVRKQTLRTRHT